MTRVATIARDEPTEPARLSSVTSALRLLKAFTEKEAELGISDLARRMGLAKSTIHRLVSTLVSEGMLERNPETGRYRLGIALFSLGALVRQRMDVSTESRPLLLDLRDATEESVHLAVLDGTDILYVFNLESSQAIRMRADIGVRKPAFCTAEGLAILAFRPPDIVADIAARTRFIPRTPRTIVDHAQWEAALRRVRREGVAFDDEQSEPGMRSVAAPIRDAGGTVVAAIAVAGPVQRLSNAVVDRYFVLVAETARMISRRLGSPSIAPF